VREDLGVGHLGEVLGEVVLAAQEHGAAVEAVGRRVHVLLEAVATERVRRAVREHLCA
jgi:hypothetical protein